MRVELEKAEWDRILYVISNAHGPGINWLLTNPLLASLTTQLQKGTEKETYPPVYSAATGAYAEGKTNSDKPPS